MENKNKIAMYDNEGHLLQVFNVENVRDLERLLGLNQGNISNCLDGKMMSNNNRQFRKFSNKSKVHNRIGDISSITIMHLKPINKYYNGKYICSYESSKIASMKNGIDDSSINKCCNGVYKSSGGFEWKYAGE